MSSSYGVVSLGQQQGLSMQDMVSKMELGIEDTKAPANAGREQVGKGGYVDMFLIKSRKFKVGEGNGVRPSLQGCMVIHLRF